MSYLEGLTCCCDVQCVCVMVCVLNASFMCRSQYIYTFIHDDITYTMSITSNLMIVLLCHHTVMKTSCNNEKQCEKHDLKIQISNGQNFKFLTVKNSNSCNAGSKISKHVHIPPIGPRTPNQVLPKLQTIHIMVWDPLSSRTYPLPNRDLLKFPSENGSNPSKNDQQMIQNSQKKHDQIGNLNENLRTFCL